MTVKTENILTLKPDSETAATLTFPERMPIELAGKLHTMLRDGLARFKTITLDLSSVRELHVSSLQILVAARQFAAAKNLNIVLRGIHRKQIRKILAQSGYLGIVRQK